MSNSIRLAQPGDVIRADDWNNLVNAITDLQQRVQKLEELNPASQGKPVIVRVTPATARVGDPVTVAGWNFGLLSQLIVSVGGSQVPANNFDKARCDDRNLVFIIPPIAALSQQGETVSLQVRTSLGTDQIDLFVGQPLPKVVTGRVLVKGPTWDIGSAILGRQAPYTLTYQLWAITNVDETFNLNVTSTTGWAVVPTDANGVPLESKAVRLPAAPDPNNLGQPTLVKVQLSIPANTPVGTNSSVMFNVASQSSPTTVTGFAFEPFRTGDAPKDRGTIAISITRTTAGTLVDGVFTVPAGVSADAVCVASIADGNRYVITGPTLETNPNGAWTASLVSDTGNVVIGPNPRFSIRVTGKPGAQPAVARVRINQENQSTPFADMPLLLQLGQ